MTVQEVVLVERFPDVETYCALRTAAGMSPKSHAAARLGLPNTLYGVSLLYGDEVVGMGRVIGDGGCFFVVVDIAVVPELQGRGLGTRILAALDTWLQANVPPSAYVTLVADGDAKHLYAKFGFVETAPHSVNMEYVMGDNGERIAGIP